MESAVLRSPSYYTHINFSEQLVEFYEYVKHVQDGETTPAEGPELAEWLVIAIQLRARAFTFSYLYLRKYGMFPDGIMSGDQTDLLSLYDYTTLADFKECELIDLIFTDVLASVAGEEENQKYTLLAKKLVLKYAKKT